MPSKILRTVIFLSMLSTLLWTVSLANQDTQNIEFGTSRNERDDTKPRTREPHLKFYLKPPRELNMMSSENGVLECQAGGYPPPLMHWLKDGEIVETMEEEDPFTESDDVENSGDAMLGISSTNARLYLNCVTPEDSGIYTCVAETPYHRVSTHAQVVVDSSSRLPVKICRERSMNKAPKILMWSKKRLEYMGGDVRLYCRADGVPKPVIQWLNMRGDPIDDNEKYKVLENGDLIIRQLKWRDMGNYACTAKNIAGTDRTETFLYPTKPGK